jgi:hypothetical protein
VQGQIAAQNAVDLSRSIAAFFGGLILGKGLAFSGSRHPGRFGNLDIKTSDTLCLDA